MNITYIGLPDECGIKICNYLSLSHSVTFITKRQPIYEIRGETIISQSMWIPDFFDNSRSVDALIINDCSKEYEVLNHWLCAARESVKQIIVINQGSFFEGSQEVSIKELLCNKYACNSFAAIKMLNIPSLYGELTFPDAMLEIVENVITKNRLESSSSLLECCDALHIEDLCVFLKALLEADASESSNQYHIKSGHGFHVQDLLTCIKLRYPNANDSIEIVSAEEKNHEPHMHLDNWSPQHNFMDEIDSVITGIIEHKTARTKHKSRNAAKTITKTSLFLLSFFLMEIYVNFTSVASDLQFVDIRLIFISMSAVLLNRRYAVTASLLCGAASIIYALSNGYRWYILFFHVNNWIPIAVYILFAMIIGACADAQKRN